MLPETTPRRDQSAAAGRAAHPGGAVLGPRQRDEDKSEVEIDARLTVSDREVLQKKDFAQMSAAEIAAAKQAIARLALPLD